MQATKCWALLEEADFSGCKLLSNRAIKGLARSCSHLRTLNLNKCDFSDDALATLGAHCQTLATLDLSYCEKVTDAGIGYLAKGIGNKLQELILFRCRAVADASLQSLSKYCSELRHLDVTMCKRVTDAGLKALGEGCTNLQVCLSICPCYDIMEFEG